MPAYIYGKLNKEVQIAHYQGLSTPTAITTVDNNSNNRAIYVDIKIDDKMSDSSTLPVANKIVKGYIDSKIIQGGKLFVGYCRNPADITEEPISLEPIKNFTKYVGLTVSADNPGQQSSDKPKYQWIPYSDSSSERIVYTDDSETESPLQINIQDNCVYCVNGFEQIQLIYSTPNNTDNPKTPESDFVTCHLYVKFPSESSQQFKIILPDGMPYCGDSLENFSEGDEFEMSIDSFGGAIGLLKRWRNQ